MAALKQAVIGQEHVPGLKTTIFFMDTRAFGKEFEEYLSRAENEYGVSDLQEQQDPEGERGREDQEPHPELHTTGASSRRRSSTWSCSPRGRGRRNPPPQTSRRRSESSSTSSGSARPTTSRPVETSVPGIFVCGAFSGPEGHTRLRRAGQRRRREGRRDARQGEGEARQQEGVPAGEGRRRARSPGSASSCATAASTSGRSSTSPRWSSTHRSSRMSSYAERNLYTCSQDTQKKIKEMIEKHDLNRVVVASLHPEDPRAALPEHLQGGGPQQVPVRDGQHQGPVLVGAQAGAGEGHREGEGPRPDGSGEGGDARAASAAEDTGDAVRARDRRRAQRHDRGPGDRQRRIRGAPGREGPGARRAPETAYYHTLSGVDPQEASRAT